MPLDGALAGLSVVFVDDSLVVLDKPSGLLCVPGRGPDKQDCLSVRAQGQFADALVVHRLDQATSGLVVMARGLPMQRALSRAFEQRTVHKRYSAVVQGHVPGSWQDWQTIELPIAVDWPNRPRRVIDPQSGQPARTRVRISPSSPADAPGDVSHLELEPWTGRTHQLRVHLAAVGFPILGDALYAPPDVAARTPRLMLHACELGLDHPLTGQPLCWSLDPLKYRGEPHPQR